MLEIYEDLYLKNSSEFPCPNGDFPYNHSIPFECPVSRISKKLSVSIKDLTELSDISKIYFMLFPEFGGLRLIISSLPEYLKGMEEDLCREICESGVLLEYRGILESLPIEDLEWTWDDSVDTDPEVFSRGYKVYNLYPPKYFPWKKWEPPLYRLRMTLKDGTVVSAASYYTPRSSNVRVVIGEKKSMIHSPLIKLLYELKGYGIEGIDRKH